MKKKFLQEFWSLLRGYWISEQRWRACGLLAVVIALNFAIVYLLVLINSWYNEFYNALQAYAVEQFWPLIGKFAFLAFLHIAIAVYAVYLQQMLQLRWRTWMTDRYLASWMKNQAYYRLQVLGSDMDNPDQRIQEDINQFVTLTLSILLGVLKQLTTLAAFAVVLWNLSGVLEVPLGSGTFTIYGYMLWFSLLYSIIGTYLAHRVGRRLIGLDYEQQRYEADFRFSMTRVRENSESIAFYGGEQPEQAGFQHRFAQVIKNYWGIMRQMKFLNYYANCYAQLAIIAPLVLAAPRYFAGAMALGGLMQTISAFGRVQDALSYFVTVYDNIAQLIAVIHRLTGFTQHLEAVGELQTDVELMPAEGADFVAENIEVGLPDGRQLLAGCSFSLPRGCRILVTGSSGCGKSTLFRTLAGLWPFGRGQVKVPKGTRTLFLPQRPYLPLGSLRDAIWYPLAAQGSEQRLQEVLQLVGLPELADRLDTVDDWSRILSLGEQQRIAFARILLVEPQWVFLDEATSALDEPREREMYEMLRRELPGTSIVSVGHRSTLFAQHDQELHLLGGKQWILREIPPAPAGAEGPK